MTNKEQRYALIAIPETYKEETCPFYSVCDGVEDCGVLGLKYHTCKVCTAGITRAEAVERMAKANWRAVVCSKNKCTPDSVSQKEWNAEWIKLPEIFKKVYFAGAEVALDALLGKGARNDIH